MDEVIQIEFIEAIDHTLFVNNSDYQLIAYNAKSYPNYLNIIIFLFINTRIATTSYYPCLL